jgi:hypothetical protein
VIRDAGEHLGQPGARMNVVELGGLDEGVDGDRAPAPGIGSGAATRSFAADRAGVQASR